MFTMPSAAQAQTFTEIFPSVIAGKTGRHTYKERDQVLMGAGAAHPAMNPYDMPQNAGCRRTYSKGMCADSLDILNRTILVPTHAEHTSQQIDETIHNIGAAARVALDDMPRDDVDIRNAAPVDAGKFALGDAAA